jgi:hypothetical protein
MNVNKRICPLYLDQDGVRPILLTSPETRKKSIGFVLKNLVDMYEDIGCRKIPFVCLFSWRYNPLCLHFPSPVAGF